MSKRKEQLFADLAEVCRSRNSKQLADVIRENGNILDLRDADGRTLLHYCTEHEHTSCADQLLTRRPDLLTLQDYDGFTVLHLASISGNSTLIKFFLDEGKRLLKREQFARFLDCFDHENHTALHWATVSGELSCLTQLHAAGADPSLPDIHGAHPIHYAAQMDQSRSRARKSLQVLKDIIAFAPSEKESADRDGRTPLIWAASSGNVEAVMALLSAKVDVSHQDKDGLTAMHCAASKGFQDCLECLIDLGGAVVDQMDSNGCTALFYAVTLGHADCTQFLLQRGSQANHQDRKGRTAAHCGAAKGQLETLKIIHQRGGNMWLRNIRGDLPIHEAVRSGRKELVLWLLEHRSASVDVSNTMGKTPLHVACLENNVELCKVLLDFGTDINCVMKLKGVVMTPLDVCLQQGFRGCAKFLLLHGALPSSRLTDYRRFDGVNGKIDQQAESREYSSSLGYQTRQSGLENEVTHLTQSESSHSFTEVRLPSRLKAGSRISQKVQVFGKGVPGSPNSIVSASTTELDPQTHTMITNVYVNAYSVPRKRTLKKIRRGKSKSRSADRSATPHHVDIWKAGDDRDVNDNGSFIEDDEMKRDGLTPNSQGSVSSGEPEKAADEIQSLHKAALVAVTRYPVVTSPISGYSGDASEREEVSIKDDETGEMTVSQKVVSQRSLKQFELNSMEFDLGSSSQSHPEELPTELADETGFENGLRDSIHEVTDSIGDMGTHSHERLCEASAVSEGEDRGLLSDRDVMLENNPEAIVETTSAPIEPEMKDENLVKSAENYQEDFEEEASERTRHKRSAANIQANDQLIIQPPDATEASDEGSVPCEVAESENEEERKANISIATPDEPDASIRTIRAEVASEQEKSETTVSQQVEQTIDPCTDLFPEDGPGSPEPEVIEKAPLSLIREVTERTETSDRKSNKIVRNQMDRIRQEKSGKEAVEDINNNIPAVSAVKAGKKYSIAFQKQAQSNNKNRRGNWKRGSAIVSAFRNGASGPQIKPDDEVAEVSASETLNDMTSLETDDSLRESVSASPAEMAGKDEVIFNLRSGEKIRATTTFELQGIDSDERDVRFNTIPRVNRRSRSMSRCSHKLHRKQSVTHVPPLDLANVKSKIDSRLPESFHKKFSPCFGKEGGHNLKKLATHLSKSSKKFAAERKLFEELQDLKRCQLRANRSHETILVKRLADRYNSDIFYPGLETYTGLYDFASFESFLYEQLRRLSASSPRRVRSSSEENMQRLQIEHHLASKSLSAEVLMSRPRFQSRFLDLEDSRETLKPCVCGVTIKSDPFKSHRRTMSDVVKTETSLNYGIITRAPKPQSFFPSLLENMSQTETVIAKDFTKITSSSAVYTPTSTASVKPKKRMAKAGSEKQASKTNTPKTSASPKVMEPTNKWKIARKSAEQLKLDEASIVKRWESIKEEERRKHRQAEETKEKLPEVVLMYEVSTRRKSETQSLSAVDAHPISRPLSRTMSDTVLGRP